MYISARSLDDLLNRTLKHLLGAKRVIQGTRGDIVEVTGVLLALRNPRARLSRTIERGKLFSGLGELMWYLSGKNDAKFVTYYISDYAKEEENGTIWGGYGPRLFDKNGIDQISNIINLLKYKRHSKRAVIQLFDASDIVNELDEEKRHKDVPCTCTLQFMIRNSRLNLMTSMRSNDAVKGLPHDIFTFTMLQEIIARAVGVELGLYKHSVGSLHVYKESFEQARKYLDEGWQQTVPMPAMPFGPQDTHLHSVLEFESSIRNGRRISKKKFEKLDPYWSDIVRLLQIFRAVREKKFDIVQTIKSQMHSKTFNTYIRRRQRMKSSTLLQKELPLAGQQ